jgi:phosphoglycerate dehydrogenase-like enzyme
MKITVMYPVEERHKKRLEAAAGDNEVLYRSENEITDEELKTTDVIIGNISPEKLNICQNLKWLQLNSAGTDGYCDIMREKGAILTNATGAYGLAISEHMLAEVLAIKKKLFLYHDNQKNHLWQDEGQVTSIEGSTTLVVGMGDIGSEFARKMKALGGYVIGITRSGEGDADCADEIYALNMLDECLKCADVVALALPGTAETAKLFDKSKFELMKKNAILVNVGRGTAVDTEALCDAVENGDIFAAALDVTDPEPLPKEHRMWGIENIHVTPHISGYFHLQETFERIVKISAANLYAFLNGEKMRCVVDFETGYRKL